MSKFPTYHIRIYIHTHAQTHTHTHTHSLTHIYIKDVRVSCISLGHLGLELMVLLPLNTHWVLTNGVAASAYSLIVFLPLQMSSHQQAVVHPAFLHVFLLNKCFREISAGVEECAASVEECAASVEECAASVEECAASVEECAASVEECAASVEECATSVEECAASVEECAVSDIIKFAWSSALKHETHNSEVQT